MSGRFGRPDADLRIALSVRSGEHGLSHVGVARVALTPAAEAVCVQAAACRPDRRGLRALQTTCDTTDGPNMLGPYSPGEVGCVFVWRRVRCRPGRAVVGSASREGAVAGRALAVGDEGVRGGEA